MIFAKLCIEKNEKFLYYIHQDESTIQGDKHANRQWFRMSNNETRHGLVGKYKHEIKAHVIGAIFRRGASKLIIFNG